MQTNVNPMKVLSKSSILIFNFFKYKRIYFKILKYKRENCNLFNISLWMSFTHKCMRIMHLITDLKIIETFGKFSWPRNIKQVSGKFIKTNFISITITLIWKVEINQLSGSIWASDFWSSFQSLLLVKVLFSHKNL